MFAQRTGRQFHLATTMEDGGENDHHNGQDYIIYSASHRQSSDAGNATSATIDSVADKVYSCCQLQILTVNKAVLCTAHAKHGGNASQCRRRKGGVVTQQAPCGRHRYSRTFCHSTTRACDCLTKSPRLARNALEFACDCKPTRR